MANNKKEPQSKRKQVILTSLVITACLLVGGIIGFSMGYDIGVHRPDLTLPTGEQCNVNLVLLNDGKPNEKGLIPFDINVQCTNNNP